MKADRSFTLIEVMLAIAIFALMITGFALALDDALGMYIDLGKISKNRRMIESAASLVLATNNNPAPTPETDFPEFSGVRWEIVEVPVVLGNGEILPRFRKVTLETGGNQTATGLNQASLILAPAR